MRNAKLLVSIIIFITFLVITSTIKNQTRILEKELINLNNQILLQKKDINEAQLEFYYLSSPRELEKRLNLIGFNNYQPIAFSKIYFDISDFINLQKKMTNLKKFNEKKIKK